jgi:hypothetical protein
MAKGQIQTINIPQNNKNTVTVSKTVELVVKGGILVPDHTEAEPGVNTTLLKN